MGIHCKLVKNLQETGQITSHVIRDQWLYDLNSSAAYWLPPLVTGRRLENKRCLNTCICIENSYLAAIPVQEH